MKSILLSCVALTGALLWVHGVSAQATPQRDLAVTNLYSLDKLAQADAAPHTVRARVLNRGLQPVTNASVRLRVSGANPLVRTANVSLAPGQAAVVAFAPYLPGTLGRQRLSVRVPTDDNPSNDSLSLAQVISPDTTSYVTPGVPNFVVPGVIVFQLESAAGNRFAVGTTPRLVAAVRAYITDTAAVGQNVVGFVADPLTGCILSRSSPRILTRTDIDRMMTFQLLDDLVLQNRDYLAGFSVLGRPGLPVRREVLPYGTQLEVPYRPQALYSLWPLAFMNVGATPPLPPFDVSRLSGNSNTPPDTLLGKLMVEVITAPAPACVRPANLQVVVRGGPFRVAFDSTYNATGYEVAYGPSGFDPDRATATGGQIVAQRRGPFTLAAAQPNTAYAFYVRSICSGATSRSAWAGPIAAVSPCQRPVVFQFPYREAFDVLSPGQPLPCGTEVLDNDRSRSSWEVKSVLNFGMPVFQLSQSPPNALYLDLVNTEYPASGVADDWFFTPLLALQATRRYRLSFSYQNLGSPNSGRVDRLAVWLGDAPDPARQTTLLYRNTQINNQPYRLANAASIPAVQEVVVPADGFYHIGFQAFSRHAPGNPTGNGNALLLDDLELTDDGPLPARSATATPTLRLYPNPATDGRFTLEVAEYTGRTPTTVRVADGLGRTVLATTLPTTGRLLLDLSQQPAGLYVLQVCTATSCVARKLVVGSK